MHTPAHVLQAACERLLRCSSGSGASGGKSTATEINNISRAREMATSLVDIISALKTVPTVRDILM
ncbi:hypothetical protein EON66_03380 [archaeon]|nr:MAG: hypothetical protein EON66_03380 [archaeon]